MVTLREWLESREEGGGSKERGERVISEK